jgi:hypothetical protein
MIGKRGNDKPMSPENPFQERPKVDFVNVAGIELRAGDRVRLRPRRRADILDMELDGKIANVQTIEQDYEDRIYLAVTVEDDPGKDFGEAHKPGHRFFFRPDEVEPLVNREQTRS